MLYCSVIKKQLYKILIRGCALIFLVTMLGFYMSSFVFARYISNSSLGDTAKVAKFGDLTFYEYLSDGTTLATGETVEIDNLLINPGINVNKKISLSFGKSEVGVYLFLVIDANRFKVVSETDSYKITVQNNLSEDILYWNLDNSWNYLEDVSTSNQFVFCYHLDPNTSFDEVLMDSILVNSISFDDVNLLKGDKPSLSFKTYAISSVGLNSDEAWNHIINK